MAGSEGTTFSTFGTPQKVTERRTLDNRLIYRLNQESARGRFIYRLVPIPQGDILCTGRCRISKGACYLQAGAESARRCVIYRLKRESARGRIYRLVARREENTLSSGWWRAIRRIRYLQAGGAPSGEYVIFRLVARHQENTLSSGWWRVIRRTHYLQAGGTS